MGVQNIVDQGWANSNQIVTKTTSSQIKSRTFLQGVKSNQIMILGKNIASNQIKSIQIKSIQIMI